MNDFDDFLNADEDEEERHLAKPKSQKKGGSPSYRGAGHYDGHVNYGFGRRQSDPYSFDLPDHLPVPKVKKAEKIPGRQKGEPASSPSVRSVGPARERSSLKGGVTPSAKSEPAKLPSPSVRSESSEASVSETGSPGQISDFAKMKADFDKISEELKKQEEERERKKKEEEERRKEAEEARKKEEEKKKAEAEEERKREAAKLKEEEEQKKREEEEAKQKEEEKKKREEEEARQREEERKKKREEEEAKRKEEERMKREEEEIRQREEERKKREEEEKRKKGEEEAVRKEEERKKCEEEEEAQRRQENREEAEAAEAKQQEHARKKKEEKEAEAARLEEERQNQLKQDALSSQNLQVRELREAKMRQEELKREAQDQMSAAAHQVAEANSEQAILSLRVASLMQELACVREERDTLKEDLGTISRLKQEEVADRQLQVAAEADANPASMRRVAELELELASAKECADEVCRELECCREAKRQLEREIIARPRAEAEIHPELQQAEAKCALAQSELAGMQEKMRYYAQSQQEMEEDRRQVVHLAEELRSAKSEMDALSSQNLQVRELREAKMRQEELKREAQDQMSAAAHQVAEANSQQAELSQRVASLMWELAGLREERDTLKEDLALATPAKGEKVKKEEQSTEGPMSVIVRMQGELDMAEKMLRACEKENENLAQQNRQLRQGARLKREEVDDRQLQLVAELNAAKAEADANPASMRRVAELERELAAAKERADEHGRELERCREAKRQLEREIIAGPRVEAEIHPELQQAEAKCALAQSELAGMQEKLRYYAQSQQEMEEDRRQVAQLAEELWAAKNETAELRRRPGLKEASRKIAELRRQNEELNECLRKRHPDSLLSLIKACEPAPEEKRELRHLQSRVTELEAQLQERDALYDRRIRGLRAQYDHMRHEYERRAETKKGTETRLSTAADVERRAGPDHEAVLQARIKDLERQVEHTKSYYLTKLRKREPLVPPWKPAKASGSETRVQQLQHQLQERDQRIAELLAAKAPPGPAGYPPGLAASPQYPAPPASAPLSASAPVASNFLRLFMASPEGSALAALCSALHWLAQTTRMDRFQEVTSYIEMVLPIFVAAESAAKGSISGEPVQADISYGTHTVLLQQHDALRLEMPLLPSSVWGAYRHGLQRLAHLASQASLGGRPKLQLLEAIAELRMAVEAVIQKLFCPMEGSLQGHGLESIAPRLSLEAARDDLQGLREDEAAINMLQDAEAQAGLDHRLPWGELLAVLARSGVSEQCLELCRSAARPDFSVSLSELQHVWQGAAERPFQAAGLFKALARIRLAISRDFTALQQLDRDAPSVAGFFPRGDFMEALRALPCALSLEERHQIASLFSPAGDARHVCYPLFLQSVMPERLEAEARLPKGDVRVEEEWPLRLEEAQAESRSLRDHLRQQEARSAEQARHIAALGSDVPAQAVRRLQGEVALLETKVLEQQATQAAAARKSEIELRADLDVKSHEVLSLRRALEARDSEVRRYQMELEAIIIELNDLRGS
ncbi:unnamed protein product [Durusdinium trenchii]|uniref:Centrosomal protein of 162 kDa n=1 Tax=Durusdinium trenchii TaxID=1381693 RepID=A0ABP0IES7_9DINO